MKLGLLPVGLLLSSFIAGCAADAAGGTVNDSERGAGGAANQDPTPAAPATAARNEGPVEVFYSSLEKCSGPGGCPLDREVFAGAEVDVVIRNLQPKIIYAARTNDASIAEASTTPHCNIETQRDCTERITINTHKAGDVSLEIFDEVSTAIQRRVTIRVRDAVTLVSNVTDASGATLAPSADGAYDLRVGSALNITSAAKSASGEELLFMRGAFGINYIDPAILGPRDVTFGGSATEYATAWKTGSAGVSISANATAHNNIRVRVQ